MCIKSHGILSLLCALVLCGIASQGSLAAPVKKPQAPLLPPGVGPALQRGVAFLLSRRNPDGSWLHHPAVTGLACMAIFKSGLARPGSQARAAVDRGLEYILRFRQPDGSIWNKRQGEYPNYSTAISLITLATINRPQDKPAMRAARDFLLNSQFTNVPPSNPSYGGIGYGKRLRPDLSNTQWALEALYLTDSMDREPECSDPARAKKADLAWKRALTFLTRCQNLKETNHQVWVASDPDNRGGFVYMPGQSKAGSITTKDGRKTLRSYGSMTYAGLKSMIYARVSKNDPRVRAACDWVRRHYTFDENPGMGKQGWFYYLHTCAKALAALGDETIVDVHHQVHPWRYDLVSRLLTAQKADGRWVNANGRWWESIPELTTSYALIALEICRSPKAAVAAR